MSDSDSNVERLYQAALNGPTIPVTDTTDPPFPQRESIWLRTLMRDPELAVALSRLYTFGHLEAWAIGQKQVYLRDLQLVIAHLQAHAEVLAEHGQYQCVAKVDVEAARAADHRLIAEFRTRLATADALLKLWYDDWKLGGDGDWLEAPTREHFRVDP